MRHIFSFLSILLLFVACKSTNYLDKKNSLKALKDAVARLQKKPGDDNARNAIPELYKKVQAEELAKINGYKNSADPDRYESTVNAYALLQDLHDVIINSSQAYRAINPTSYATELLEAKQEAADFYYSAADELMKNDNKTDARMAYRYYDLAEKFIPGYKDVRKKRTEAYSAAKVNVVIMPVYDNSFFSNTGFGSFGMDYSNEYFQRTLTRDLNYENRNTQAPASFFTDVEARSVNVNPDLLVELRLRDMDIPYPYQRTSTQSRSARVEVGKDTAGRAVYQNVSAQLQITQMSYDARGTMDVQVKNAASGLIGSRSFSDNVRWDQSIATYSGDSRALTSSDWAMVRNSSYRNNIRREDILQELYRKIYPNVKYFVAGEVGR